VRPGPDHGSHKSRVKFTSRERSAIALSDRLHAEIFDSNRRADERPPPRALADWEWRSDPAWRPYGPIGDREVIPLGDLVPRRNPETRRPFVPRWFDEREQVEKWLWNNGGVLCWTPLAPSNAPHLCERCGATEPMAWERPARSIPEGEPWQSLSHICPSCAWGIEKRRANLRNRRKDLQAKVNGDGLDSEEREELKSLCETWCYTCHERKPLRNSWQCEACNRAWRRSGRPQEFDYRIFAADRQALIDHDKWLSQRENASDLRLCRVVVYNGSERIDQFDAAASGLPWRARLQLFSQEVLPMLALPVELTIRGSAAQIVDVMRQMASAASSATQPTNGASSPRPAADRILPLAGAVSH
jgi:hypothetical protein